MAPGGLDERRREFQEADPAIRDAMLLEVCAFISSDVEKALDDSWALTASSAHDSITRHLHQIHARAAQLAMLAGAPPAPFTLPKRPQHDDADYRQRDTHARPHRTPPAGPPSEGMRSN